MTNKVETNEDIVRQLDDWAAEQITPLIDRKNASRNGGDLHGEKVMPADLCKKAVDCLRWCMRYQLAPPPNVVDLFAEMLAAHVPPHIPVSRNKVAAWKRALEIAAQYPEPPDTSHHHERPRTPVRATVRELANGSGSALGTITRWIKKPEFEEQRRALVAVRAPALDFSQAPVNDQQPISDDGYDISDAHYDQ